VGEKLCSSETYTEGGMDDRACATKPGGGVEQQHHTSPLTARYPGMARQGNVRVYLRIAAGRRTTSGPASCTICAEGGREGRRVSGRGVNGGQPKSKQALLMLVWAFGLWGCGGRGGRVKGTARLARLLLVR